MIVQNQIGSGGPKIPEGTFVIVQIYTNAPSAVSSSFIVPQTGTYRITTIGAGGNGSGVGKYQENNVGKTESVQTGRSGASGGVAIKTLQLIAGDSYPITVNTSLSSFGKLLSATAGGNSVISSNYPVEAVLGTAGTGTGGDNNYSGQNGQWNGQYLSAYNSDIGEFNYAAGTPPTGFSAEVIQACPFVSSGTTYTSAGFLAFGNGGGGGNAVLLYGVGSSSWDAYSVSNVLTRGPGAVIIELLLEGVNT